MQSASLLSLSTDCSLTGTESVFLSSATLLPLDYYYFNQMLNLSNFIVEIDFANLKISSGKVVF